MDVDWNKEEQTATTTKKKEKQNLFLCTTIVCPRWAMRIFFESFYYLYDSHLSSSFFHNLSFFFCCYYCYYYYYYYTSVFLSLSFFLYIFGYIQGGKHPMLYVYVYFFLIGCTFLRGGPLGWYSVIFPLSNTRTHTDIRGTHTQE